MIIEKLKARERENEKERNQKVENGLYSKRIGTLGLEFFFPHKRDTSFQVQHFFNGVS